MTQITTSSGSQSAHRYYLPSALAILLIIAAGRLLVLTVGEWQRVARLQRQSQSFARNGSLSGLGATGMVQFPDGDTPSYLVTFVIQSASLERDIAFWNDVVARTGASKTPIRYWGICDAGTACNALQRTATFTIVGFLDPIQMRVTANAHTAGFALFYQTLRLPAPVAQHTTAAAVAGNILKEAAERNAQ
jgi:uncharacterized integral membrane protein